VKLWHIAALLVMGLLVGILHPGMLTDTFRTATFFVFLPALIFEGAWNLDFRLMRRAWQPIVLLAVPGVAITAALIALILHRMGGVSPAIALLTGAVLSATDPVAVVAIFRRLAVPRAPATIVESEALLNDAIAVALYRAVLVSILAGVTAAHIGRIALAALTGALEAIALGAICGLLTALLLRRSTGATVQTAATFIAAYGVYFFAEYFRWSGIFAVIACAIAMRETERNAISLGVAQGVERVWHGAATVANVSLFFLIGTVVDVTHLWQERNLMLWALVAVLLARVVVSYGLLALVPRMRRSWMTLVRLAGVRGALSLALAFAVPASIGGRQQVIDATFIVVVVTVLLSAIMIERQVSELELQ